MNDEVIRRITFGVERLVISFFRKILSVNVKLFPYYLKRISDGYRVLNPPDTSAFEKGIP